MENMTGCHLPNVPKLSEGVVQVEHQPLVRRIKRSLAVPWNYHVKRWIKHVYHIYSKQISSGRSVKASKPAQMESHEHILTTQTLEPVGTQQQQLVDLLTPAGFVDSARPEKLKAGDLVRVRTMEEIQVMLDPFRETRGCAFLEDMYQYCGTQQRVFKSMERFLDERDYKVKKVSGVILLENVICSGTPAFGKCDRSCFLFWREEWLEKITA
jgi:hypothetical protein